MEKGALAGRRSVEKGAKDPYKQGVGEGMEDSLRILSDFSGASRPGMLPPLVLAYVGDACFELYIRSRIIKDNMDSPPQRLHRLAIDYVKASAQSEMVHDIWDDLEEDEKVMVKRGRNAKAGMVPKGADIIHYRHATGFETLIGFLFLKGDIQRLLYIMEKSYRMRWGHRK